jgi:hypothetical protein
MEDSADTQGCPPAEIYVTRSLRHRRLKGAIPRCGIAKFHATETASLPAPRAPLNPYKHDVFPHILVNAGALVRRIGNAISPAAARYFGLPTRRTEMNTSLKHLMTAAAIAVLFGTPALAASHTQRHVRAHQAPYAASHTVTAPDGQVIGADPDPSVRFELNRDAPIYTGDY